jgi:hypothetical protein
MPVSVDNCVSEILIFPACLIPKVMDDNSGRMTKLIAPTEAKLGAVTVVNAVKLDNSNVPEMDCRPAADTVTTALVSSIRKSPLMRVTVEGILTGSNPLVRMRTFPVIV